MSWQKKATIAVVLLILFTGFVGVFWYQEIRHAIMGKAQEKAVKIHSREKKHTGKVELLKATEGKKNEDKSPLRGKRPRTHQTPGSLTVAEYYATKKTSGGNPQLGPKSQDPLTNWASTSATLVQEARTMTNAYYVLNEKYQRDKLYAFPLLRKILPD